MTVKELIEELNDCGEDDEVTVVIDYQIHDQYVSIDSISPELGEVLLEVTAL